MFASTKKYLLLSFLIFIITLPALAQGDNYFPWSPSQKHINKKHKNKTNQNFSASLGFGTSYGGYGAKLNYLFTENKRIGIQIGAGMYFDDIMYSAALKFFLWRNLFVDLKYGLFSRKFELRYDTNYDVSELASIMSGPGIMLGYELTIIKNLGLNFGGGFNYDAKYSNSLLYSFDIGILYRF